MMMFRDISINNGNTNDFEDDEGMVEIEEQNQSSDLELIQQYDPFLVPPSLELAELHWRIQGLYYDGVYPESIEEANQGSENSENEQRSSISRRNRTSTNYSISLYQEFFVATFLLMIISLLTLYDLGIGYRDIYCSKLQKLYPDSTCQYFDLRSLVIDPNDILTDKDLKSVMEGMADQFVMITIGVYLMFIVSVIVSFKAVMTVQKCREATAQSPTSPSPFTLMFTEVDIGDFEEKATNYLDRLMKEFDGEEASVEVKEVICHSYETHLRKLRNSLEVLTSRRDRLKGLIYEAEEAKDAVKVETLKRAEKVNFEKLEKIQKLLEVRSADRGLLEASEKKGVGFVTLGSTLERDKILAFYNKKYLDPISTWLGWRAPPTELTLTRAPEPEEVQSAFIGKTRSQFYLSILKAYGALIGIFYVSIVAYFVLKLILVDLISSVESIFWRLTIITLFNYFFARAYLVLNNNLHDSWTMKWQILLKKYSYLPWKAELIANLHFMFVWAIISISGRLKGGVFRGMDSIKGSGVKDDEKLVGIMFLTFMIASMFLDPVLDLLDPLFVFQSCRRNRLRRRLRRLGGANCADLYQEELNQAFERPKNELQMMHTHLYYITCVATQVFFEAPFASVVLSASITMKFLFDLFLLRTRYKAQRIDTTASFRYLTDCLIWVPKFLLLSLLFVPSDPSFPSERVYLGTTFWLWLGWFLMFFPFGDLANYFEIWYVLRRVCSKEMPVRYWDSERAGFVSDYSAIDSKEMIDEVTGF